LQELAVNQTLYILHGAAVLSIIFLAVAAAVAILILGCLALLEDARLSDLDEWESPKDPKQTPTKLKHPPHSAYKAIGVMVFGLFLVAALTSFAHGQELPLSLNVNLASVHTRAWARQQLNQVNPGLGLTYSFNPDWSASAGFYDNSYRKTSGYALANWTPLHASLPGGFTLGAGVTAGLVSGYTRVENPYKPLAAGLLVQIRRQGWGINITGVPNYSNGGAGFIGLQLVTPI
jgi:hypothetical protein